MAPPRWECVHLPSAGGLEQQDAWLMAALGYVRDVMNRLEVDLWNEASREHKKGKRQPAAKR